MHWFNATCWLVLLLTGLGLIRNPALSPVGMWWPEQMQRLFSGGYNLLVFHVVIGLLWAGMFLIYIIINPRQHLFRFLKEIFTVSIKTDLTWLIKKGVTMTLGRNALEKRGINADLPPQGFYNVGQKLFAIPSVIGSLVIFITGLVMVFSQFWIIAPTIVQWAILIHYLSVGLIVVGLLIHIYMAAIDLDERPAFNSMLMGSVPESFAKHHNPLWAYETTDSKDLPN